MIPSPSETFEMLRKEEHFKIRIRQEVNNPNYVTERVYVNGECIQIPVGEEVSVPKTVYDCLVRKGII